MSPVVEDLVIRPALPTDMARVAAIYRHYVLESTATFEFDPPTAEEMEARRRKVTDNGGPYLVAECGGQVVGYAYAGSYRSRPAYSHTVEDSIYLDADWAGRGIGRKLLLALLDATAAAGFTQAIAVITGSGDGPSIRLHRACGFAHVGCLTAVGRKFDTWLDTILMQRAL